MQEGVWNVGEQLRSGLKKEPPHYLEVQFKVLDSLELEENKKLDPFTRVIKYGPPFREWVLREDLPEESKELIAHWERSARPQEDEEFVDALEQAFFHWYEKTLKTFSPELRTAYDEAVASGDPDRVSEVWKVHHN